MSLLKKILLFLILIESFLICGCGVSEDNKKENLLYVYNWSDYLDKKTVQMFEQETGIKVIYEEYDTNETLYPRISSGAMHYDVVCPSDYMIQKMIYNNLLQPLDFEKLPNAKKYIGQKFFEQSWTFDYGNKYSVPYCWGTVGIMYNKNIVTEPVDSWKILWNDKYKKQILMQDSARDAFMIPLKLSGYSLNETEETIIIRARDMLTAQKTLVQAYVLDEAKDILIAGDAALGVVYSGEALKIMIENKDMDFAVPKEGTNFWIDAWAIPKDAENVENAHKFIDFMCRPEIAVINFDHLGYSTPNIAVQELEQNEEYKNSPVAFPNPEIYENQETYMYLGEETEKFYNNQWRHVKDN